MKKKLASVALLALLLTGCSATVVAHPGNSNAPASAESKAASSEGGQVSEAPAASEKKSSFVNGVLTTPEMKIVIGEHKIIPVGAAGNEYGTKPVIAFWYETTNLSGGEVTPNNWIFAISAFQDNNANAENKIQIAALPDNAFLESQLEKIKKGGTVKSAVAYELDDETTPVELVASDDLGLSEIGRSTYKLK